MQNTIIEEITLLKEAKLEKEEEIKVEAIQFILSDIIIKNKEQLKKIWSENMVNEVLEYIKQDAIKNYTFDVTKNY